MFAAAQAFQRCWPGESQPHTIPPPFTKFSHCSHLCVLSDLTLMLFLGSWYSYDLYFTQEETEAETGQGSTQGCLIPEPPRVFLEVIMATEIKHICLKQPSQLWTLPPHSERNELLSVLGSPGPSLKEEEWAPRTKELF